MDQVTAAVLADTAGRGVDLVFDCASYPGCEDTSLQVAASGGRVVFTGIPAARRVALDVHLWRRKELEVHQVRRSNHEAAAARDLLARESRFFAPLLTHERPLEAVADAFALVESRADGVGKLVIRLDR